MPQTAVITTSSSEFERRTTLTPDEYRLNFTQIDNDVLDVLTSDEAVAVCPSMLRVYIRLRRATIYLWESEGVLRLCGCEAEGNKWLTAWEQLLEIAGVSGATAQKALTWMHHRGVLGYEARKNGVGIRIFFNRAKRSIAKKSLRRSPASFAESRTSKIEAPFKNTELRDNLRVIYPAPENGAEHNHLAATTSASSDSTKPVTGETALDLRPSTDTQLASANPTNLRAVHHRGAERHDGSTNEANAVELLRNLVRTEVEILTRAKLAESSNRLRDEIIDSTRSWLDQKAIPKAIRVAVGEYQRGERGIGARRTPQPQPGDRPATGNEGQHDADCMSAQIESVQLLLRSGRSPAQVREQFGFDDQTWAQVFVPIQLQPSVQSQTQEGSL